MKALLKLVLAMLMAAGLAGGVMLFAGLRYASQQLDAELGELKSFRPPTTCLIYDAQGEPLDSFSVEHRIWVDIETLPAHVPQAFVAAEDRRFYLHPGVDPLGIARAMVRNARAGAITEGGSTLTQQLAKLFVAGSQRSYERKLREALIALEMERRLSKHEILELYLNTIYLGAGAYGIEVAAQRYYDRSASELNAAQAALIAGLVPAPSRYNPERDPETARERRAMVLHAMVEEGFISDLDRQSLALAPVLTQPVNAPGAAEAEDVSAAFRTQVRRELRELFGKEAVLREGLEVYTGYRRDIQEVATEAVRAAAAAVEERQGLAGPAMHLESEEWEAWLERTGAPEGRCFQALLTSEGLGALRAGGGRYSLALAERWRWIRDPEGEGPKMAQARFAPGDVLRVCLEEQEHGAEAPASQSVVLEETPWAQGAAVVIDNASGEVIALVGGRDDVLEGLVRPTQSRRQPGSTFKPYVYATALAAGRSQLDTVLDAPISLPAGGGQYWSPSNYADAYHGPVPVRLALAWSLNSTAVRLAAEVGPDAIIETARALGVTSPLSRHLPVALGSSDVTLMEQTAAYAAIGRLGLYRAPVFLSELRTDGERRAGPGERLDLDGSVVLPGGPRRALDRGVAYELNNMMQAVVQQGTGYAGRSETHARFGKTGTTNDNTDAWFVGGNTEYTVGVWIGTDQPSPLGKGETGGTSALPAWVSIMDALGEPSLKDWPTPPEGLELPWGGQVVGVSRASVPQRYLPTEDTISAFPGAATGGTP